MSPDPGGAPTALARRIHVAALALVEEQGLQGFTMQQLADRVGVSRRTLFNHVAGKVDAVLGPVYEPSPEAWEAFRAGGPTGTLLADLGSLAMGVLTDSEEDRDRVVQLHRVLASDARLLGLAHQRFQEQLESMVEQVRLREGEDDQARAGVALRLVATLVDLALERTVRDADGAGVADHFRAALQQSQELFTDALLDGTTPTDALPDSVTPTAAGSGAS